MTNEERDIITRFIERVSGSQGGAQSGGFSGSVPGTLPALPPVDREADALIGNLFTQYPDAKYRLTQTAFVQEHALAEAQNRIKRLEWELEQARQGAAQAQNQSRGFFGSLFGGGQSQSARPAPPPQQQYQQQYQQPPQYQGPPPQYAPGYQPGMFQRSGSGFLGSALTTAAGVAGGMVVGNALMDMFSPHQGFGGGLGGGPGGGFAGGSPWGGAPGADADTGAGGWDNQVEGPDGAGSGGWDTQGGTDPGAGWDQGGGTDPGTDTGGGWDDAGGGGDTGGGWDDNT
ncbi:MAG: DUF2076 domain-containing protein [Acidisphaera sp.]|nr:DUF2076 domain-containing protein [Acidisphaera sp.]